MQNKQQNKTIQFKELLASFELFRAGYEKEARKYVDGDLVDKFNDSCAEFIVTTKENFNNPQTSENALDILDLENSTMGHSAKDVALYLRKHEKQEMSSEDLSRSFVMTTANLKSSFAITASAIRENPEIPRGDIYMRSRFGPKTQLLLLKERMNWAEMIKQQSSEGIRRS